MTLLEFGAKCAKLDELAANGLFSVEGMSEDEIVEAFKKIHELASSLTMAGANHFYLFKVDPEGVEANLEREGKKAPVEK